MDRLAAVEQQITSVKSPKYEEGCFVELEADTLRAWIISRLEQLQKTLRFAPVKARAQLARFVPSWF